MFSTKSGVNIKHVKTLERKIYLNIQVYIVLIRMCTLTSVDKN